VSKVEHKEREVEESTGKGGDAKAIAAKAKDLKVQKGKGAEVEKKKEVYYVPVSTKVGESVVTTISYGN